MLSTEGGIGELSLDYSLVCYIHFYTNALGKGMYPSLSLSLTSVMGYVEV